MEITKDYLLAQISHMEAQRNHAHEVAIASQAAIDVLASLVKRLEEQEPQAIPLEELGLPDPEPVQDKME